MKSLLVLFTATLLLVPWVASANAPDLEETLFHRYFRDDEKKFEKRCHRLYEKWTSGAKDISIDGLKKKAEEAKQVSKLFRGAQLDLDRLDKDRNGKLEEEEFCSAIEQGLKEKRLRDLDTLPWDVKVHAKMKKSLCKTKNELKKLGRGNATEQVDCSVFDVKTDTEVKLGKRDVVNVPEKNDTNNVPTKDLKARALRKESIGDLVFGSLLTLLTGAMVVAGTPFALFLAPIYGIVALLFLLRGTFHLEKQRWGY